MSRWQRGEATVAKLLTDRHLNASPARWPTGKPGSTRRAEPCPQPTALSTPTRKVRSSWPTMSAVRSAPVCWLSRAYGLPLLEATSLWREQSWPSTNGRFTGLDTLRRRRNELQYPSYPGGLRRVPGGRGRHRHRPGTSFRRVHTVASHRVLHRPVTRSMMEPNHDLRRRAGSTRRALSERVVV